MKIWITIHLIILNLFAIELIKPIAQDANVDVPKALLGKRLFFDKRLSQNNTISCATCHNLEQGGDDNLRVSKGIHGQEGTLNAPTVLNARYNFVQFWDGRAKSLKEQASMPIHNPVEMGSDLKTVITKLKHDQSYVNSFEKIYNDEIKEEYVTDALAEFEKALITPNSKFDQFLQGKDDALSKEAKEGYDLFKSYGCISCHNGINIGGNLFQKMGILKKTSYEDEEYLGRFNVTHDEEDKHYFKVPTLRNISQTAPYFHNGEAKTLKDAIKLMMEFQLGIRPDEESINKIIAFLKSLKGETPKIMKINE